MYPVYVDQIFVHRNFHHDGLVVILQDAKFEYYLRCSFHPELRNDQFEKELSRLISLANIQALITLEELLNIITVKNINDLIIEKNELLDIADREWRKEFEIETELVKIQKKYLAQL